MRHRRTIEYISETGLTAHLGVTGPFFLTDAPTDTVDSAAQVVRSPGRDGARTYHVTRGQRRVTLRGSVVALGNREIPNQAVLDQHRQRLCAVFDPKHFGTLIYHAAAGDYRLSRCRTVGTPVFGPRFENYVPFSVEIISDDALWAEDKERVSKLGALYNNLRFPWFLPDTGTPLSIVYAEARVTNPTPEAVYPLVEVYDTSGAFVNVLNETTGVRFNIGRAVGTDQKLVIDCAESAVWLYEQMADGKWVRAGNALNWLSLDSDLTAFTVEPGENVFNINEDIPDEQPVMILRWRVPVMGV